MWRALAADPVVVFLDGDGGEADFDPEVVGFEKQVFENVARYVAGGAEKYSQR